MWFLKWVKRYITPKKVAGKKTGSKEGLSQLYTLYDTCDICPLWVYISLVCDEDIKVLIKEGNPPEEALKTAKLNLLFEFNELISDGENKIQSTIRKIYKYKSQLMVLEIALVLISEGRMEDVKGVLKALGIRNDEATKTVSQIKGKIGSISIHLQKELKEYEGLNRNEEKANRKDFDALLAKLTKFFGFRVMKDITLSEYAAYIKEYNLHTQNTTHGQ